MEKERNYGIDLLRIVAMLLVAVLHTLGHGGVLSFARPHSARWETAWLLETAAYCAVNCYAMISGYAGGGRRISTLAVNWLRVLYYSVLISAVFMFIVPDDVDMLGSFFPVMSDKYWYFTAYFALSLFSPFLDAGMTALGKVRTAMACCLIMLIYTVIPAFTGSEPFVLNGGYGLIWLTAMYMLGGCIKRSGLEKKGRAWLWAIAYCACVTGAWLIKINCESWLGDRFVSYTSPFIVGAAFSLVMCFAAIKPGRILRKIIAFVSPLAFSVYLIHDSELVRLNVIENTFKQYGRMDPLPLTLSVLGTALAIFVICAAIDIPRELLFRKTKLKERLTALEIRLTDRPKAEG